MCSGCRVYQNRLKGDLQTFFIGNDCFKRSRNKRNCDYLSELCLSTLY